MITLQMHGGTLSAVIPLIGVRPQGTCLAMRHECARLARLHSPIAGSGCRARCVRASPEALTLCAQQGWPCAVHAPPRHCCSTYASGPASNITACWRCGSPLNLLLLVFGQRDVRAWWRGPEQHALCPAAEGDHTDGTAVPSGQGKGACSEERHAHPSLALKPLPLQ